MYERSEESSGNPAGGAAALADRNRRREPRLAVTGPCYLVWSEDNHEVCSCGTIQDMSVNGMRVRTRLRAGVGANIDVFLGERTRIIGEVRHCTVNEDGSCDIGILIRSTLTGRRHVG